MGFKITVILFLWCTSFLSIRMGNGTSHQAYTHSPTEDRDIEPLSSEVTSRAFGWSGNRYQGDQNLCPARTLCAPISNCKLLVELMERSCLQPARLKDLTCGYLRDELMVCCPSGGQVSLFRPGNYNEDEDFEDSDPDPDHGLNENCGKPQLNGWQNGWAGLGSQPWVVRVGFKNSETGVTEYPCCGSLITSRVVLTAAHCALAKSVGRTIDSVRVGEYDTKTDPDCTNSFCTHKAQNIAVSSVTVHPGYERSTFRHDVALIILKDAVNFSLSAQPICLLKSPFVPLVGQRATLVGFGKLPEEDTVSPVQHQLKLPIVPLETCSRIYNKVIAITSNHLCVGGEPKKDACSGFGGAPLVLLDSVRKDRFYQVGMVSFGSDKCGAAGVPSVYTSIQEYISWIRANLP